MDTEWDRRQSMMFSDVLNMEYRAFYFYLACGAYFDSRDQSLVNLSGFFYKESEEELEHARKVIRFMNRMGIKIEMRPVETEDVKGKSVTEIFNTAVELEKQVLEKYLDLFNEADGERDRVTTAFIDEFLDIQSKEIKEFHDLAMNAERTIGSLGQFIFDQSFK